MKVVSYGSVTEFWETAGRLFKADPVRNTVALTVVSRLLRGARFSEAEPIFLTVHNTRDSDGDLVGAAFCTPPFPISVSGLPTGAMTAVADHLATAGVRPSGASGIRPEVEAFVAAWADRTGICPAGRMDQRLYRLTELEPPTDVPGELVIAGEADVDLLVEWRRAFGVESAGHQRHLSKAELAGQVRVLLASGSAQCLWHVDGQPVSYASATTPSAGMSRIGPVYTPPEFRGHGYGSAVTAAASKWASDEGAEHVLLFTDLANRTSNAIYQRIGYVPVADALDVTFA
jgi:GNAT superfamily N-acetyltransferase